MLSLMNGLQHGSKNLSSTVQNPKLVVIIDKILRLHTVYLLLGSNKGNRLKYLLMARYFLQQRAGEIVKTSHIYITEPWGNTQQGAYLNQALELRTDKSPFRLLKISQKIEKALGRENKHHNASRVIDIDILFYDRLILDAKNLVLPHPRLHQRNFTLTPLLEICGSYTHPVMNKSMMEIANTCSDTGKVSIFNAS
jgi:2-amino-4-hydroxy-6-hydroxymethyldihydropteridine diphosphokinase